MAEELDFILNHAIKCRPGRAFLRAYRVSVGFKGDVAGLETPVLSNGAVIPPASKPPADFKLFLGTPAPGADTTSKGLDVSRPGNFRAEEDAEEERWSGEESSAEAKASYTPASLMEIGGWSRASFCRLTPKAHIG